MKTGHSFHDDIQGILQTALTGVTQYTFRQYRTTGLVFPHVAQGDVFSMAFQCSHRKKLGAAMDGVHLHIIPVAAANGNVKLSYTGDGITRRQEKQSRQRCRIAGALSLLWQQLTNTN